MFWRTLETRSLCSPEFTPLGDDRRQLQFRRHTQVPAAVGYPAATAAQESRLIDQSLVLVHVAQVKTLRGNIAQMFEVQLLSGFGIQLCFLCQHCQLLLVGIDF